jgi:predicted  nucleic acid-binding Zn-ribbon protein
LNLKAPVSEKSRSEIHKIKAENQYTTAPQACTLINMNELTGLRTRESLLGEIAELKRQLAEAHVVILKLSGQIEELQRSGKRQAVPFARREHVEHPKKRGRKHGKGQFKNREKPKAEEISATKKAELSGCPECQCELEDVKEHEQYEIDIPKIKPIITMYLMLSGTCPQCGKRHWMYHPDQISRAVGASGVVIGPRAKALASDLKHGFGASYGKVSEVLNDAFQLNVTRGAWQQADQRLALQAKPVYEALIDALQACTVVHGDETGWRIGTLSAWLWVFTSQKITVYTVETSRGHEVVMDILGKEFKGVLVSDCFLAYDHHELENWLKQKCLSHLLKDLKELNETKVRGAVRFARAVTELLQSALALKAQKDQLSVEQYARQAKALEVRLDELIDVKRQLTDPDNARFAKRLRKHRKHVLRFLYVDELDATNNLAERQLRPAVITRKTNGCNRTKEGAQAHAILGSVLATCRQQAISILEYLVKLQKFGETPPSLTNRLSPDT